MTITPPPEVDRSARQVNSGDLSRWIPGLAVLRGYSRAWLAKDVIAGLVLTAILVPAGMGYAAAAGLPAICGLYATIVPLTAYAIFGPSRILVLGPDSALAALIAATVLPLAAGNVDRAVALAGMLAILSGGLCILAGFAKFGFITELLSKPIRYGYMNGIAVTVLLSQLPTMLGFPVSGEDVLQRGIGLGNGILQGRTNWASAAISLFCLLVILGCKRWVPRVPGVLIAVVGATILSSASGQLFGKEHTHRSPKRTGVKARWQSGDPNSFGPPTVFATRRLPEFGSSSASKQRQ